MSLMMNIYQCPRSSIQSIAQVEQCNALLNWFDHHTMELHTETMIELTEKTVQQLLSDLYRLSANNCEQVFPTIPNFVHGATDYDEAYWQSVTQLRFKLRQLLETFDFNHNHLFLQGHW